MPNQIVTLANSNAFNVANLSTPLTSFASGYRDDSVEALINAICPVVRTPMRFSYRMFGKGQFAVDTDTVRAAGSGFKRVSYEGEVKDSSLQNKGLTTFVDKIDYYDGWQESTVAMLRRRLMRSELKMLMDLISTAAGNATTKKWMPSGEGRSIPDVDLGDLVNSVGDSCGIDANRIVIGNQAWRYRFAACVGASANGEGNLANMTPEAIAAFLGVDKVIIGRGSRGETVTASERKKEQIIPVSKVYAFNAEDGVAKDDPSTFKRFVNGGDMKVYVEEKTTGTEITVEYWSRLAQTGAGACKALAITNS